jgi:hypothetical protein
MNTIEAITAVGITIIPASYYVLAVQNVVTYLKYKYLTLTK